MDSVRKDVVLILERENQIERRYKIVELGSKPYFALRREIENRENSKLRINKRNRKEY